MVLICVAAILCIAAFNGMKKGAIIIAIAKEMKLPVKLV